MKKTKIFSHEHKHSKCFKRNVYTNERANQQTTNNSWQSQSQNVLYRKTRTFKRIHRYISNIHNKTDT